MLENSLRPRPLISSIHDSGSMPARSRAHVDKDEELGKRDDDFKPRLPRSSWTSNVLPWNWRKRRTLSLLLLVGLVYAVVVYIPAHFSLDINADDVDDAYGASTYESDLGAPPRAAGDLSDEQHNHYYSGRIHLNKLGRSLNKISRTMGAFAINRNVLFAASSTKSTSNLIPMACEMARVGRNNVHFALFGRNGISADDILALNGFSESDCAVSFHDARADFAEYSSDTRFQIATKGALKHINEFMHPQAIIMDDSKTEDASFTIALRDKMKVLDRTLIEVPSGRHEDWLWLTRLDTLSLSNWHKPSIEILIHAPVGSSGGLIRLLKSLHDADYKGFKVPKLTIELPSDVEHFLGRYLGSFKWPPGRDYSQPDALTLRHRIPSSRIASEQASIRFVESYFPNDIGNSHVLVLSPHAEISPLFLQYIHFQILEYHAQTWGWYQTKDVLGISLELPTVLVDGKVPLIPSFIANSTHNRDLLTADNEMDPSPFLYQGVSSAASLFFGEKWLTFHDFLNKRLQASHSGKQSRTQKVVSESEPAWVEYLLELMRARGWTMLHPSISFATIHNDLAQVPEEFASPPKSEFESNKIADSEENEPFILSTEVPTMAERPEADSSKPHLPLHRMLPFNGKLQSISDLPTMTHNGESTDALALRGQSQEYATWFRAALGGCQGDEASRERVRKEFKTDDLFCLPGIDVQFEDDDATDLDWAFLLADAATTESDYLASSEAIPSSADGADEAMD